MTSSPELRKMLKEYLLEVDRAFEEKRRLPAFPEELRGLTCGARTRAGTPCKRRDLYRNGRCRLHGGLSTGPKTPEGKKWSSQNGKVPKKKRTP